MRYSTNKNAPFFIYFLLIILIPQIGTAQLDHEYCWSKEEGGYSVDGIKAVDVDNDGNVYLGGYYQGQVNFNHGGDGSGVYWSKGKNDAFVMKASSEGRYKWIRRWGWDDNDGVSDVKVGKNGDLFVIGWFDGTMDFDPGPANYYLSSGTNQGVFVVNLDSSGNFNWAKAFKGSSINVYNTAISPTGSLHMVGTFTGTVDFDPGADTSELHAVGSQQTWVNKLSSDGNFVWAKSFNASTGCAVDVSSTGSVYIKGGTLGTVDFNPDLNEEHAVTMEYWHNTYILKLTSNGIFSWVKTFGGSATDCNGATMDVSPLDEILITGAYSVEADFDPSDSIYNLSPITSGKKDIYVEKLDSSGNFIWAKTMGGYYNDYGSGIIGNDNGDVFTVGQFMVTVDFDPGDGVFELSNPSSIKDDIFIQKLNNDGEFVWAKSFEGDGKKYAASVALSSNHELYTVGHFGGYSDWDTEETVYANQTGDINGFIQKMSPACADKVVSMDTISNHERIKVYPNPINDLLTLASEANITSGKIYNIQGKLIVNITTSLLQNSTIDVSFLNAGTYILNLNTIAGNQSKVIVKK